MMRKQIRCTAQVVLFVLMAVAVRPAKATVKVGNGGDVIDSFLEQMRRSLVQVVVNARPDKPVWQQCNKMNWLSPEQQSLCQEFIQAALVPVSQLNAGPKPTPFLLVQEPIETEGPDGQSRRVAAGTECGPVGPITFHYDTVRSYEPRQLFHVLAHEFGHKVGFREQPCVTDNEAIGAFDEPGGGRRLMDAFAEALTMEAIERGEIGEIFALQDFFSCGWTNPASGDSNKYPVVARRVIYDRGVFDRFESGVGVLPRDEICLLVNPSIEPGVTYKPRLKISENAGCRKTDDSSVRGSELSVLKVYAPLPDGSTPPAEVVMTEVFPGVNPICEENPRDFDAPFATSYGNLRFRMRYLGTRAIVEGKLNKAMKQPIQFVLGD